VRAKPKRSASLSASMAATSLASTSVAAPPSPESPPAEVPPSAPRNKLSLSRAKSGRTSGSSAAAPAPRRKLSLNPFGFLLKGRPSSFDVSATNLSGSLPIALDGDAPKGGKPGRGKPPPAPKEARDDVSDFDSARGSTRKSRGARATS